MKSFDDYPGHDRDKEDFPPDEDGSYHNSNPAEENGDVKSMESSPPTNKIQDTIESLQDHDIIDSGRLTKSFSSRDDPPHRDTLYDKNIHNVMRIHEHEDHENDDGGDRELNPENIDTKNDEEKSALLDPEKAQERAITLTDEREMQKKLASKNSNDYSERHQHTYESKESDHKEEVHKFHEDSIHKKVDDMTAEEALHALNGKTALPTKTKNEDSDKEKEKEPSSTQQKTQKGEQKSNTEVKPTNTEVKPTASANVIQSPDTTTTNPANKAEPVVANAAVSKEVVDLLKSLGQVKNSDSEKKHETPASNQKDSEKSSSSSTITTTQPTTSASQSAATTSSSNSTASGSDTSIENEEKETKEAVHDLGVAIGILEKKLALINEAKVTGNKKNIFIVDEPAKTATVKSDIELNNNLRVLKKVIGVAERVTKKKHPVQKSFKKSLIVHNEKRNDYKKVQTSSTTSHRRSHVQNFSYYPTWRRANTLWRRTSVPFSEKYQNYYRNPYYSWNYENYRPYFW